MDPSNRINAGYYAGRGMATLCQLLGYSRQSYYKAQKHKDVRMAFHTIVAELVIETRTEIGNQKLGTRKLLPLIKEELASKLSQSVETNS